jgi:hypothetical protein
MLSHEQAQVNSWDFLEVWVDVTASPPYVLLLLGEHSGKYYIVDAAENYTTAFSSDSYEEAKLWLLADEYERVDGRFVNPDAADQKANHLSVESWNQAIKIESR